MTVHRAMGLETEYGISVPGMPHANPMIGSGRVVQAYAHTCAAPRVRWDYAGEAPMSDARGYELRRDQAHPSQLTDEWADDPLVANIVLTNGARLYVDHAHPEYSAPEVLTPRESLIWDRAGEVVMARAASALARDLTGTASTSGEPGAPNLYKNNTDGKGASYGTHENYLMRRDTPFQDIVTGLTPFFVARQILCGAGRVGIGQRGERAGYQISSRADFIEAEVGLETTFRRPIINTRDEPHAVAQLYRRLHVIVGDANLCDVSGLLKVGTTSLVLGVIEEGQAPSSLRLADPVAAMHAISHDPSLTQKVELVDGRRLTGIELLWAYYELVDARLSRRDEAPDEDTAEVMRLWADTLTRLGRDITECADSLDWVAKLALIQGYVERDDLSWQDARLRAIDIQWSDVRPGKGLARRLEERGRITRLVSHDDVLAAVDTAPPSTRAWFRGECVRRYGDHVGAASWESVVFQIPGPGGQRWVRTGEPLRGTKELTQDLLDRCPDAATLLRELEKPLEPR